MDLSVSVGVFVGGFTHVYTYERKTTSSDCCFLIEFPHFEALELSHLPAAWDLLRPYRLISIARDDPFTTAQVRSRE